MEKELNTEHISDSVGESFVTNPMVLEGHSDISPLSNLPQAGPSNNVQSFEEPRLEDCYFNDFSADDILENISNDPENTYDFNTSLSNLAIQFVAKWHSVLDLPRKRVQSIIEDMESFLSSHPVNFLRTEVLSRLAVLGDDKENIVKIGQMFDKIQNPFQDLNTEYNRFKCFNEKGTLIQPVQHTVNYREEFRHENGRVVIKKIPISAQYIPIAKVFTKLFLLPNFYNEVLKNNYH